MQYLLLIHDDEQLWAGMSDEERGSYFAEYMRFTQELIDSGTYVGGNQLHPSSATTVVRVRGGETLTTDGPFAETKEQIGGFYLVDCKNLDEAIEVASKHPLARRGAMELRPFGAD